MFRKLGVVERTQLTEEKPDFQVSTPAALILIYMFYSMLYLC